MSAPHDVKSCARTGDTAHATSGQIFAGTTKHSTARPMRSGGSPISWQHRTRVGGSIERRSSRLRPLLNSPAHRQSSNQGEGSTSPHLVGWFGRLCSWTILVNRSTGELLRHVTLDPNRNYQPQSQNHKKTPKPWVQRFRLSRDITMAPGVGLEPTTRGLTVCPRGLKECGPIRGRSSIASLSPDVPGSRPSANEVLQLPFGRHALPSDNRNDHLKSRWIWATCVRAQNRGGNRQANAALYRVVIVRMRWHPPDVDNRLRSTAHRWRPLKERHPMPETLHRTRDLPPPPRTSSTNRNWFALGFLEALEWGKIAGSGDDLYTTPSNVNWGENRRRHRPSRSTFRDRIASWARPERRGVCSRHAR